MSRRCGLSSSSASAIARSTRFEKSHWEPSLCGRPGSGIVSNPTVYGRVAAFRFPLSLCPPSAGDIPTSSVSAESP